MVVEPLAEQGVGGDLGIADAQVGVGRVVPEAVLSRATLDQRDPLTAETLVSEESCGSNLSVRARQNRCQRHSVLYRQPEIQDGLRKLSAEVFGGSAEKASRYMHDEIDRWGKVIKAADIKLQ
jgi:hypothetical protein